MPYLLLPSETGTFGGKTWSVLRQACNPGVASSCIQHDISQKTKAQAAVGFEGTIASPLASTTVIGERRSDRPCLLVKSQGNLPTL